MVKDRINKWLKKEKRSKKWLSDQSGVSYCHLYLVLKGKRPLSEDVIGKLNEATGQNFYKTISHA